MLGFLRDTTGAKTGAFEITKSCVNSKLWEHGIKLLRYARGHSTSKCEVNSRRPTWFQNTVMLFFRNVSRCCWSSCRRWSCCCRKRLLTTSKVTSYRWYCEHWTPNRRHRFRNYAWRASPTSPPWSTIRPWRTHFCPGLSASARALNSSLSASTASSVSENSLTTSTNGSCVPLCLLNFKAIDLCDLCFSSYPYGSQSYE